MGRCGGGVASTSESESDSDSASAGAAWSSSGIENIFSGGLGADDGADN